MGREGSRRARAPSRAAVLKRKKARRTPTRKGRPADFDLPPPRRATPRKWSQSVTASSTALVLPEGLFTRTPKEIAEGLFRAAVASRRSRAKTPYQAAMSMLNFYINRAGRGLSAASKRRLNRAKVELRKRGLGDRAAGGGMKSGNRVHRRTAKTRPAVELIRVTRAARGAKKYAAHFLVGGVPRTTRFGAKGYEDYTIHRDRARRKKYRKRHQKDLLTRDPTRAGFLSYYLLWGPSTSLAKNIADYKRMLKNGVFRGVGKKG